MVMALAAAVLLVAPARVFAAPPPTSEKTIMSVGQEPTDIGAFDIYGSGPAYWGPVTQRFRSGTKGLWVAGSSGFSASYPVGTNGSAWIWLAGNPDPTKNLADYYSSRISFYYICPARGASDADSFVFSYAAVPRGSPRTSCT